MRDDDDRWWPTPVIPDLRVHDHEPYDTGLLDHRGDPILRHPLPVGFHIPPARGPNKREGDGLIPKEK